MSSGHKTTQSIDAQTRDTGYGILGQAQQFANTPFQPFDPNSIAQFQNPYTQQVIDAGTADLNRGREMTINANHGQATIDNAFGGNRGAVVDAGTNDAFLRALAAFSANTRSAGYDQANQTAMANWNAQRQDPLQKLGILNSTFAGSVLPTATTTNAQSGSLIQGILGALLSGAGTAANAGLFG